MIFDTYWKKRFKKEEREKKKAKADLACEKWQREDQQELVNKLSDQNWSQAKAIKAYQEELESIRKLVRLQDRMIHAQQAEHGLASGEMINAELLVQVVKASTGDLFDKSAAFIFLTMVEMLRQAEAREAEQSA